IDVVPPVIDPVIDVVPPVIDPVNPIVTNPGDGNPTEPSIPSMPVLPIVPSEPSNPVVTFPRTSTPDATTLVPASVFSSADETGFETSGVAPAAVEAGTGLTTANLLTTADPLVKLSPA